ncbi:flagellar biosynthetic protein FliR [Aquifex pyrophilus]
MEFLREEFLLTLLLSYFRVVSFFSLFPFFSSNYVPLNVRLYLSFAVSFIALSFFDIKTVSVNTFEEFILKALNEFLFGFTAGLILRFFIEALAIAGEIIALHTGLGFLQLFLPGQAPMSLFGAFFYLYGILLFLSVGGAEIVLLALSESFKKVPIGSFNLFFLNPEVFLEFFYESFKLGVKVSLPVLLSALILNLILAVVNRFIPQMNVFMVGLPLQVLVGLIVLLLSLPVITLVIVNHLYDFLKVFELFIKQLGLY